MAEETATPIEQWSPVDALRMVVAGAGLVSVVVLDRLFGDSLVDFFHDVLSGFDRIGDGLVTAVAVAARLATLAFLAVGFLLVARRGQGRFLLTVALAGAVAAVLALLAAAVLDASAAPVLSSEDLLGELGEGGFPTAAGLAAVTGVVAAGVPWVARRWRRVGWLLVVVLAIVRAFTAPLSLETLAALFAGALAGALADAVLGTPSRRPTKAAVIEGLRRAGVDLAELEVASVDARGSTPYFGATADGTRLFVKALGTDERRADLLFRLVRSVRAKDLGDERPFSSLRRAVEHEALVALAADHVGVRTPPLAAFASADPSGFVLAYEAIEGRSLDGVEVEDLTDGVLGGIWEQMAILRAHGIAHRDLRLANVFLAADGEVWLIDFGFSELAASDLLLATDLAELVTSLSLKVGPDRGIAAAEAAVGGEVLRAARRRFDPRYLSGATRSALTDDPGLLPVLRHRIEELP